MPLAGRDAKSLTLTIAPTMLQTGWALGATCSHSLSEPHSSASKWLKLIHRTVDGSITLATASRTSGNNAFMPVWNNSGSSSFTRDCLNCRSISGINVEMLKTSGAISVTVDIRLLLKMNDVRLYPIGTSFQNSFLRYLSASAVMSVCFVFISALIVQIRCRNEENAEVAQRDRFEIQG